LSAGKYTDVQAMAIRRKFEATEATKTHYAIYKHPVGKKET